MVHLETRKELPCVSVFCFGCTIEANDDFIEVWHLIQFINDCGQSLAFEFRKQRREDKVDFAVHPERRQLIRHRFGGCGPQIVQGRDASALVKIGQGSNLLLFSVQLRIPNLNIFQNRFVPARRPDEFRANNAPIRLSYERRQRRSVGVLHHHAQ